MRDAPILSIRGLTKRFGPRTVLDRVDLDVFPGEALGLIGPNGAGKTTLFECLAGVLPADGGEVSAAGAPVSPSDRRTALFYVPDGIAPWAGQPAGRVLEQFAALFGRTCEESLAAAGRVGLAGLLAERVGTLSKGERKRFTLALGLLSTSPLLVIDEPFDGLDVRQAREIAAVLKGEVSRRSLFLSIHQLADVPRVCDRLVLLSDGKVAGEGTLDELRERTGLRADPARDIEEIFLALM